MDFQVQRVDSAPIQPTGKRRHNSQRDARDFEQELDGVQPDSPEPPLVPAPQEDTPIAPRLEGEAGGNLDLTA